LALAAAAPAVSALTEAELTGYRLWLHSLEQTAAARAAAGTREAINLFPFDRPARVPGLRTRTALAGAAAELERARAARNLAPERSAFTALARARTSLELCRFDTAIAWYQTAAELDTAGNLSDEITRETLAAALAARDTATVARIVAGTAAAPALAGRADEVVLAYRCLLARGDTVLVDRLIARVEAEDGFDDGRARYWHALALAWRGRHAASLETLGALVADGGLSHGLSEAERAWVLTAVPDLMLLGDDEEGALVLYRMLAGSSLSGARVWAAYRQAGLDLAAGRYAEAATAYAQACADPEAGAWRERACELEAIAARLAKIREKGEAYGVAFDEP
jgi:hypothetical protein